jgi:hypothetical protein
LVLAANDADSQVIDAEQHPTNGFVAEGAVVDRSSFHKQVTPGGAFSHAAELRPEAAVDQGEVEVSNRLSLDDGKLVDEVVGGPQPCHLDVAAELPQGVGNATPLLMNVDDDAHSRKVPAAASERCGGIATILATSDLAGLQA